MNLRVAILTVLNDADLRGATLAVLTPFTQAQSLGEAWTRSEIERELIRLQDASLVSFQRDQLQGVNRYFITTQGKIAIAR
jgi:DNA-binding PadR family transcriptional regulator